jgi:hypothetical protein
MMPPVFARKLACGRVMQGAVKQAELLGYMH